MGNWFYLDARYVKRTQKTPHGQSAGQAISKLNIRLDIFQWDACSLPLRNSSVDVFVTDLPFGKRMGSKFDNRKLYPSLLNEMARVCKNKNGRAVLLTQDKKTMSQTIGRYGRFWKQTRVLGVNIGGLSACVYLLSRTTVPFKSQIYNVPTNVSCNEKEQD
ncbi:THUMP domain-containing protein 3-like [Centruroides sculpturatus]|uniref:THUMP domain-containing protein 3-like n=1 Tax=Centruroides sculpturatus TaxID=218467 RepID=UPI000C6CB9A4|nr:THUMP domain-containing protein 3-like [Centruroides sculpturatus]